MATSPAPDAAAPPGMCPGIAVLGGGGGGGGGDGSGDGGEDGAGGDGSGNGKKGSGDGKNAQGAPDYAKYPECGYASHPVDVVTGRAFTHPIMDLELPGPLPLRFRRMYSSKMAERDVGLGFGWAHTFGWEIEVTRRQIRVWNEQGIAVDFPRIAADLHHVMGPWGWLLSHDSAGFILDADDGLWRRFSPADERGRRYHLTAIEDRNQNRITLAYEGGRLIEATDSANRSIRIASTNDGRIASIQVKNAVAQGQWVPFASYNYDERGNLESVTDADGFSSRYTYDDEHRLTSDADRAGLMFHFVYDHDGRCVESWGDYPGSRDVSLCDEVPKILSDGKTRVKGIHHCRFDYMHDGYSEVADSTQVRRYFGNKHGTLEKSVVGVGVMTATYREDGHLLSRTDAIGATTLFERDARGRPVKVTDPLGRVTTARRDKNGLLIELTNPAGGATRIDRDACGNVTSVTDPAQAVTSYRWDDRGLLTEAISPTGARQSYAYDAQGNLIARTEPNGGVWRYSYDALGRLLSRIDPLGAETRYAYSLRGDLTLTRNATGGVTRYAYNGEGCLIQVVDPNGRITKLTWGGYHKLCSRRDANGNEIRLRYNLEGELVEMHNELGEVHRLTYSTSGLLEQETTFDGREIRYRNDPNGRVVRIENGAGEVTDIEYDLAGQLVRRELDDGSCEEFSYNERAELMKATGPGGVVYFERDAAGRIVREVQSVRGKEHSVTTLYNAAGERIGRTTSLGHTESVTRGMLGERVQTVLDGEHVLQHQVDLLGRETARILPSGGWIQSNYDEVGRLRQRRAGVAANEAVPNAKPDWLGPRIYDSTVDTTYRYDWDGSLVESYDQTRGHTQYKYDPVGQLLALVPERARSELFRYDAAGNLYESDTNVTAREYGKGSRLRRVGNTEYRWDEDGRLIEKRTRPLLSGKDDIWRYQWDVAGLLRFAECPDGTQVEYTYDPFARRVRKRVTRVNPMNGDHVDVSVTRFIWDGDVLVHEIQARGDVHPIIEEKTYLFDDGRFVPAAHRERRYDDVGIEHGGWFHYVNDPIGAPEWLVRSDGNVACELKRTAWGETKAADGATANTKLRFQGQYEDEETGLHYNRFRYYDPAVGRFTSPDPLGLSGGAGAYLYAVNPFGSVDPLGLKASDLPVLKPGSPAWKQQVKEMKKPGGGRDCRVANQADAEKLLNEARGDLPRKGSADDPYNAQGEPYKAGYEVHPNEETSQNAPQNNLPHIKWKDWSGGKSTGGSGHIFFG